MMKILMICAVFWLNVGGIVDAQDNGTRTSFKKPSLLSSIKKKKKKGAAQQSLGHSAATEVSIHDLHGRVCKIALSARLSDRQKKLYMLREFEDFCYKARYEPTLKQQLFADADLHQLYAKMLDGECQLSRMNDDYEWLYSARMSREHAGWWRGENDVAPD